MGDLMKQFQKQLIKEIKKAKNIYIMGHQSMDLDALGAAVAINCIIKKYKKKSKVILNEQEHESAVGQAIEMLDDKISFINATSITEITNKDLLIIVDTNKKYLLQDEEVLTKFNNIIVIDHHTIGKGSIKEDLSFIRTNYSSTCEILAEFLVDKNIPISSVEATIILSGIVLDTNGYAINTREETYFYSAYLTSKKASPRKVQQLLKQDFNDYKENQKLILNVEVLDKKIAITIGGENKFYRREYLAKAADTLLLFKDIETSYVIGRINKEEIGISARSLGSGKVNKVLSKMSGGGSPKEAATVIKSKSLEKVKKELLKNL